MKADKKKKETQPAEDIIRLDDLAPKKPVTGGKARLIFGQIRKPHNPGRTN